MKPLILLSTLFVLYLLSCDSPVVNPGSDRQLSARADHAPLAMNSVIQSGQPDSIRQAAWQQFKTRQGQAWRVTWNQKTGIPLTVFSGTSKEPYPGAPEQAARAFLKEHAGLFGMRADLAGLELDRIHNLHDVTHVRFQQTYKGIPVWEGDYVVHLRSGGRVDMANGNYYPFIEASTSPGIGEAAARQAALNDLGGAVTLYGEIQSELVIYPENRGESFFPAWRVLIPASAPVGGDWQFFVDAAGGSIVEKVNLATAVTGDGDIIDDHPELTPDPVNRDFFRLDGSGYLRGTFANVHNDVSERAFSSVNSFQYNTGNTHFDEANVYWHIDTYRADYLDNLGFHSDIGSDQDLEAWVHDVTRDPNNARYYPVQEEVRFGNNLEFAKEDKIIYHEFIHAVQDVINFLESSFDEEGALSEGTADYFAGSYAGTDRPRIGESILTDERFIRDMNDPYISTFDEYQNQPNFPTVEPHDGGELIAAVLWDLRNSGLGASTTDFLAFDALGRISSAPTFIEYRDAMMAADDAAFGGLNNDQIQNTFAARGIGEPVVLEVTISGPGSLEIHKQGTWTASVDNASGSVSYQWYYTDRSTSSWIPDGIDSNTYSHSFSFTSNTTGDTGVRVDITSGSEQATDTLPVFVISAECDPLTEICIN